MGDKLLVLNSGSSSIKYSVYFNHKNGDSKVDGIKILAHGVIEEIGGDESKIKHSVILEGAESKKSLEENVKIKDHKEAMEIIISLLKNEHDSIKKMIKTNGNEVKAVISSTNEIEAIGHRVVHGGEKFHKAEILSEEVLKEVNKVSDLAPLHNPPSLKGIQICKDIFGEDIIQILVFDTSFHQSLPPHSFMYAIPYEIYEKEKIRKYGFHGTSYQYVSKKAAKYLDQDINSLKMIVMHLGSGSSICAIKNGKSVDTSMGLTPLEGLMMGTRCGDIDASVILQLNSKYDDKEIEKILNKESGLKGICGESDMRKVLEISNSDEKEKAKNAKLALDMFCYRIREYIGAYYITLKGIDCLVFTGGIGENSEKIRELVCKDLDIIGIRLDNEKNDAVESNSKVKEIQQKGEQVKILVVPTDEEYEIATQMKPLLQK